jgi:hypothetical protein
MTVAEPPLDVERRWVKTKHRATVRFAGELAGATRDLSFGAAMHPK